MMNLLSGPRSKTPSIETIVREALASGELQSDAERYLQERANAGGFTAPEYRCLQILQDAIAQGCIRTTLKL